MLKIAHFLKHHDHDAFFMKEIKGKGQGKGEITSVPKTGSGTLTPLLAALLLLRSKKDRRKTEGTGTVHVVCQINYCTAHRGSY